MVRFVVYGTHSRKVGVGPDAQASQPQLVRVWVWDVAVLRSSGGLIGHYFVQKMSC